MSACEGQKIVWGDYDLNAALSRAHIDAVKIPAGLVNICGIFFLHADRGAAAANISREIKKLLDMNHFQLFIAAGGGALFQIQLFGDGYNKYVYSRLFAAGNEGFEHALAFHAEKRRGVYSRKIAFVDLVRRGFEFDPRLPEQSHGVCDIIFILHALSAVLS